MSVKSLIKQVLTEKENKRYGRLLAGRKVTYGAWLAEQEKKWSETSCLGNGGSKRPESSDSRDRGGRQAGLSGPAPAEFVLICAGEGKPAPYAERNIMKYFLENPEVQVVYGDEDVLTQKGEYKTPWFKPDWSPDLLDSCLYFGSLVAVRRELWEKINKLWREAYPAEWQRLFESAKSFDTAAEAYLAADFEVYEKWLHSLVDGAYEKGSRMVGHIPQILFHGWDSKQQARFLEATPALRERRRRLLEDFYAVNAHGGSGCAPLVSVVIPSKDQPELLRQCVACVGRAGADIPCEIIIVDNGSNAENKAKIEAMVREENGVKRNGMDMTVRYVYCPMEFNFSRMCNLGAENANGKLLLFLNDDVSLDRPGSIAEMAARAMRAYTGAVGLKLLYPGSERIQHAGITNLPMGPVHKLQFQTDDRPYYGRSNHSSRNFIAVTAACLMVEREKLREAGGFSEELRVAFNDVDFCFRLHELGYYNVCLNDLYAYHHESLSRGADESPEKLARLLRERDRLYARHPGLEGKDPYYSVYLNRDGLDTLIRPAYETAGNEVQEVKTPFKRLSADDCRQDECLLVRVEDCRDRRIIGYGVVLGDNNACYEKKILLGRASEAETAGYADDGRKTLAEAAGYAGDGRRTLMPEEGQAIYGALLRGQYRPDLEENLSDQTNVALSGFDVKLGEGTVSSGRYRIGMLARNRVTGLKLINWSNRYVEL